MYKAAHAVIMAAGTSSRFAPLSYEFPKALITVKGEVLIERQIRQLKEAGINDIYAVLNSFITRTTIPVITMPVFIRLEMS